VAHKFPDSRVTEEKIAAAKARPRPPIASRNLSQTSESFSAGLPDAFLVEAAVFADLNICAVL
jgi:hypothetical protein